MKTQPTYSGAQETRSAMDTLDFHTWHAGSRTILLITNDQVFHENLRVLAYEHGLLLVNAKVTADIARISRGTRPIVVLLDLDLPGESAWKTAEALLDEPGCPTVILLTGRTSQFDIQTAIRSGSLVSKSESPQRLVEMIEEALQMPQMSQAQRNAIQRVLIRWLRPSAWGDSTASAYRFWGINE